MVDCSAGPPSPLAWRSRPLLPLPGTADRKAHGLIHAKGPVAARPVSFSRPSGVEIIRNVTPGEAPCFDICERLLTGGHVTWAPIVLRDDAFANDKARTSARFTLARDADCHALSADFPAKGSTCIRFAPRGRSASRRGPGLSGRPHPERPGHRRLAPGRDRPPDSHSPCRDSTDGPILFRGVQLFYKRQNGFIVLDPGDFNGDVGGGFALWRKRAVTPPIDLAAAITGLGLGLGPPRPTPPKTPGSETRDWIARRPTRKTPPMSLPCWRLLRHPPSTVAPMLSSRS